MYKLVYNCFIVLYGTLVAIASIFSAKARAWLCSRRRLFTRLEEALRTKQDRPVAWFHCASLGEFEQGRPVLEAFRAKYPHYFIVLTFFSPSGYKNCMHYKQADYVGYMPLDLPSHAKRFVRLLSPQVAFIVKYEFWYNHLWQLKKNNVKIYLFSAIFRKNQRFFRGAMSSFFRKILYFYECIFVQDQNSLQLLQQIGVEHLVCAGDTRFDRVLENAKHPKSIDLLADFVQGKKLIVAGSTWHADEALLSQLFKSMPDLKMVLVPHEVSEAGTKRILQMFDGRAIAFSDLERNQNVCASDYAVVVLDAIGLLSSLYKMADITYVGGGFGIGIHNTLEAAVYGNPVIFGTNYGKFKEAVDLVQQGGAFSVSTFDDLQQVVHRLCTDAVYCTQSARAAQQYVAQNAGATSRIMAYLP
ncbi:MAG: 3-deoxy-D-manno-octulosonic acid transferase [Bacteroidales bacterium]